MLETGCENGGPKESRTVWIRVLIESKTKSGDNFCLTKTVYDKVKKKSV